MRTKNPYFRAWIGLCALAVCLIFYPINTLTLRVGLVVSIIGGWGGAFYFFRHSKWISTGLLLAAVCWLGFLIFPGRDFDRKKLQAEYVKSLRYYEGTRYIWGGENKLGIDCSGLVRAGLIRANFHQAMLTLNPKLLRHALWLWWHDSSAEALGHEHLQLTKRVLERINLNELEPDALRPGDIAVTLSGVHVLAYLGERKWIEADPDFRTVLVVQVPERKNPWFQEAFNVLRWRELDAE